MNNALKDQMSNFRVPDVMVYVEEKADLDEVRKKVGTWRRKVDIAQVCCPACSIFRIHDYYVGSR